MGAADYRSPGWTAGAVGLAMVLFACNSILCRLALGRAAIDPASFTLIRLASGAAVLGVLAGMSGARPAGSWRSGACLFGYAAGFSFAYTALPAGVGAFLLFGSVQATMVVAGVIRGHRLSAWQGVGMAVALAGLAGLVLPGSAGRSVPIGASGLMVGAGIAWGAYSLLGRGESRPVPATAGNFIRAVPLCCVLSVACWAGGVGPGLSAQGVSIQGVACAVLSGAVASGLGYTVWYAVLPALAPSVAASVQLSVPAITAAIGAVVLDETLDWRLVVSAAAILGGILLVVTAPKRAVGLDPARR